MKKFHRHFSKVANKYRDLRITDLEPVLFIEKELRKLKNIEAVDIGSGTGRYDLQFFQRLGDRLHLVCVDANKKMLEQLVNHLTEQGIKNFKTIRALAKNLPLPENSFDCLFTFNAIHHFDFLKFLEEAARILRNEGYLFIYTRLLSQNKTNIWGRYFPEFYQKDVGLYELEEIKETLKKVPALKLETIKYCKCRRVTSLENLLEKAQNRYYSSFSLYAKQELEDALKEFQQRVSSRFKDLNKISWSDEYTLLVIRKSRA